MTPPHLLLFVCLGLFSLQEGQERHMLSQAHHTDNCVSELSAWRRPSTGRLPAHELFVSTPLSQEPGLSLPGTLLSSLRGLLLDREEIYG